MSDFDLPDRDGYLRMIHADQSRVPPPPHPHGWTSEQTFSGEAWPVDPLMRAAIEAWKRAER